MAPINTPELSYLLNSSLAVYANNHDAEKERQRLMDYAKMIDKFMANPSVFANLDGQPVQVPDHQARQVKKAKFGVSPKRMNNENSAPNPRMKHPPRFMSPIAEQSETNGSSHLSSSSKAPPSEQKAKDLVQNMNVMKLRKELKKRGKDANGLKRDLQARLVQAMREKHREEAALLQARLAQQQLQQKEVIVLVDDDDDANNPSDKNAKASNVAESMSLKNMEAKLRDDSVQQVPNEVVVQQPSGNQNDVVMQPIAHRDDDIDMADVPAVMGENDNHGVDEMGRQVKLSVSSSISQDTMDFELNESIAKVALVDGPLPPRSGTDEIKPVASVANESVVKHPIISVDSPLENYSEAMEFETNDVSNAIDAQSNYDERPKVAAVTSKVMDLVELASNQARARVETVPTKKKTTFDLDQNMLSSPMSVNKPADENEKSKQILLSLKKLKKAPSYKEPEKEGKPESSAVSSACKVSSLSVLRSEQKASLKIQGSESFLVGAVKMASSGLATTSKMATDEIRRARLAEMRGKSKPVAATKPIIEAPSQFAKVFSSFKTKAAATMDFGDQKKKQLAAQMREKAVQRKDKQEPMLQAPNVAVEAVVAAVAAQRKPEESLPPPQKKAAEVIVRGKPLAEVVQLQSLQKNVTPPPQRCEAQQLAHPECASSSKKKATPHHDPRRDDLNIFSPMSTYEISDREHSDSEDEESEDEDANADKKIPKWARKELLEPALMKQYHDNRLDPDEIFQSGISTCDLEAIFDKKKSKFRKRTSTGNWTKDRVTPAEQLAYKRAMGYKQVK